MFFVFLLACEPAGFVIEKSTIGSSQSVPTSDVSSTDDSSGRENEEHSSEERREQEENTSGNSSEGNAGHSEENWDWGEETSENMPTFEGDYEGFFEMYNLQSDQILCQTEGVILSLYENTIEATPPCNTPNGSQLQISFYGQIIDQFQDSGSPYGYARSEGQVLIEVPSGDVFESFFYGESNYEGGYVWSYLYFDIEIQTPNNTRYYYGTLYTY